MGTRHARDSSAPLRVEDVGRAGDAGATQHFDDAEYYDAAYRKRRSDVHFYTRLAEECAGPVLEYGIGTGRIALPIARAGIHVTGVDFSRPMLAALRAKLLREAPDVRSRVRAVRGDMRRTMLRRRFPLIIAPFNTVLHLYDRIDVERFFGRVRSHLSPGGRFVFDFSLPRAENIGADPNRRYGAPRFRHPRASSLVRYGERFDYDPFRQVLLVNMEFSPEDGTAPWTVPLAQRQFFPREMEALLHYNGFSDLRWSGDFTEDGPDVDTDSIVVSCRAAGRGGG
jgi:SAM-dependent methyltransferase